MAARRPPGREEVRARNEAVIANHRACGGRPAEGEMPLVVLTTTGERSGRAHTTPLCVREDGSDLVVAGSAGGMRRHPQWYRNLLAEPALTVEYLGETYRARASTVANSPDRDRLFAMMSEVIEGLYLYQDRCRDHRQIPILRLRRD